MWLNQLTSKLQGVRLCLPSADSIGLCHHDAFYVAVRDPHACTSAHYQLSHLPGPVAILLLSYEKKETCKII